MARTTAGAQLTARHKGSQGSIRAAALRAFLKLWPVWTGDEATFRTLVDATVPLVRDQNRVSAGLAARYFDAFRFTEAPGGTARAVQADPPDPARIAGTLYLVGRDMTRRAIAAGQAPEAARRTALVRTSGTVGTLVLDGGRSTLLRSVAADPQTDGWARIASSGCCAFCAMLASRGPVYGEASADFEAHDHCACTAEPAYSGTALTAEAKRFRALWDREAKPAGADALQAFRRALAAERAAPAA
jgi:hypothetical protein